MRRPLFLCIVCWFVGQAVGVFVPHAPTAALFWALFHKGTMMEICLVNTAMKFGPDTPKVTTLGGSETAVLMAAKALKAKGHIVNVFTPLPEEGRSDHVPSGHVDDDGVRYIDYQHFGPFIGNTEVDLLIVCRDPHAIATTSHAKKRVLWMHDIATHRGMQSALDQMAWTFDEIWTVSEFHRQQVHEVTGYPLKNIVALRNGIVPVDVVEPPFRLSKKLVYAARPERGLANLLKEGGVMEHLPDYSLDLAMYQNSNHDLQGFYDWCWHRIGKLPNVTMPEALSQPEMRQRLADVTAYIYPTQFEETSCILARECIEQGTPFLTTKEGALYETLGDCGVYFEDWIAEGEEPEKGSPEWCKLFADFVRWALETEAGKFAVARAADAMSQRTDLYWDGVADMMLEHADPLPVTRFSRAWSLIRDGDVVAARAFLSETGLINEDELRLRDQIDAFYPFLLDEDDPRYETLASYYTRYYAFKDHELHINQEALDSQKISPRFQHVCDNIKDLPDGSTVIEYGCGEGHVIVPLALKFPHLNFVAFDQVATNIRHLEEYPCGSLDNIEGCCVSTPEEAAGFLGEYGLADAAICVEVLEHCERPWEIMECIEAMVKPGGRIIMTTPFGPWEPETWEVKIDEFKWRNHIWHFDKTTIRKFFQDKPNMTLAGATKAVMSKDGAPLGNYMYAFDADHKPYPVIDPLVKAYEHRTRQTVGAAIIAMDNEDTIVRMLNSLDRRVQIIQIALGPCKDDTERLIDDWAAKHPWTFVKIIPAPKIGAPIEHGGTAEPGDEFGFDDARNLSATGLAGVTDWLLWIDTDEYLAGDLGVYLRHNCHDGYLVPQHHFTVEPRGAPTQIDRPARLFRTTAGYVAKGHIHEHFEVGDCGPGHCFMLPNVDIGHTGYVNEDVRKERFARNFPFLEWEHAIGSKRKLHPFLWFRDLVHRMRYAQISGEHECARKLAEEAEKYFTDNRKEMSNFGAGLITALAYISEVRRLLGVGVPVRIGLKFDDKEAGLECLFLEPEEVYAIIGDGLKDEFKRRTSKYF